ncbi:amidohydrolase family protein [Nitrosovibrio tenuis]|uniref:Imidazolonepropionase n=1 Tax=Nitrosovibrio tenuis TaxID=1233 RepID=A0A1H7PYS1_9PROT|nr:amidohydrolase family protein [Nitrosovibrio tenuis]SEL40902.1 Imidazolonepropionase [Nitrosovibrio tenuis]
MMNRLLPRLANRITLCLFLTVFASSLVVAQEVDSGSILLHAARVFDGNNIRTDTSVLVVNGHIARIDKRESFRPGDARVIDLGDATLLPGFIELHAHLSFQNVPADTVLKHGITTIRDVGGPIHKPYGGNGSLRVLTSGPILTAPGGYPIPMLGTTNIAVPVSTEKEARATVRTLINEGAVVIKIALEPGGEAGAPWSSGHGHGHDHGHGHVPDRGQHSDQDHNRGRHDQPAAEHANAHNKSAHGAAPPQAEWPLLSERIVKAIVDEAHKNNRHVTAHIAEQKGAQIAVNAGVDEWAHMPCDIIPEPLLKKAVAQKVKIVTTLDTLSKCSGIAHNTHNWTRLGGELLYGAEIAHPDIPRGIDAQELIHMKQMGNMGVIDVLRAATSKAGQQLNLPLLGTLQPGAPADMIAVKGDPTHNLKALEYPDLVISGGRIVVNNFGN